MQPTPNFDLFGDDTLTFGVSPLVETSTWTPLTSRDLLSPELRDPNWLIEERLPSVGTSLLVGHPGAHPSSVARELALATARGESWLDFKTRAERVLYVYPGDELARLKTGFAESGLCPSDNIRFLGARSRGALMARICEQAEGLRPGLIVLDGLVSLVRNDRPGEVWPCLPALEELQQLAIHTRSHILMVQETPADLGRALNPLLERDGAAGRQHPGAAPAQRRDGCSPRSRSTERISRSSFRPSATSRCWRCFRPPSRRPIRPCTPSWPTRSSTT